MIHFVVPAGHERMMRDYLELWGRDVAPRLHVVQAESLAGRARVPCGTYVLSSLDQYSARMAEFIVALHQSLASDNRVRFLNHPTRTLQRFALLEELHRQGRNAFRAVRIVDDLAALRYPVFLRNESRHDGAVSPLLETPSELEAGIGKALVQGISPRDLLVVEFCDTADGDGYYRKYSAFVVTRHIIPRSLSYSRSWMLKFQGSEFSRAMAEEEREYVLANPHERALREVFDLARVDYGRIDYAVKDGRVQTWEINLNPTIGRGLRPSTGKVPPELQALRAVAKEHFYRQFREAWESVDLAPADATEIAVTIDPAIARAATAIDDREADWLGTVRRVLRPAKPIVTPLVSRFLPMIGRAAIRRAQR